MCGIAGELRFDDKSVAGATLSAMAQAMVRRGPDADGIVARGRVGFAHRRLRIIDLSDSAQQPMVDSDLGLTIVYNGAIYNYRELRGELIEKGYRFFSDGDTEVLLKAYHAWGPEFVKRLHGMFAFAIWERDTGRVVLVRDRLGIKPLYLAQGSDQLRFASSLPALLAAGDVDTDIDPVALHHYMHFHAVVPAPFTILKGVRKLPPATIMTVEPDGSTSEDTYWTLKFDIETGVSEPEWRERLHAALRTAVERRLVADVPVGVLLSGGLDSSLIVGLLAEAGQSLDTFSIGFETVGNEKGDEFEYSDIVAEHFGTRHHKLFVDSNRALDHLDACIGAMSEPMVSHDNIGFFMLSREVAKHVKVVQSGQGADEVFAGYHWYPPLADSQDPVTDYARVFFDRDAAEYARTVDSRFVGENHSLSFVTEQFDAPGAEAPVDKALRLDSTIMLVDDPVKRVDNMTMASSLEARVPFLDHELVELAARMPAGIKMAQDGKGILKDVGRDVIPNEVIDRPKGYFPVPALKYLEGSILDHVRDALTGQAARERSLFQRDYIDMLLDAPGEHITPLRGSKLWQLGLLELWLQNHGV
ncbi:MAG: N-acetylglutaminylglutamine amidotransferase [Alphaproteobacteria bacterium]|nr:N-acetylglutaminylglutamine amidotransferase [Alphaproteobacteria bacterium]